MGKADGWITIGTKMDNSELAKDYRKLTSELKNKQKELDALTKTKAKIEVDLQAYEEEKKAIEEITNERLKGAINEQQVNDTLETETFQLKELNDNYSTQFEKLDDINKKINNNVTSQNALKEEIRRANIELNKSKTLNSIKGSIDNIGNSIARVTKKVVRWGLAIFGVRSAYMFVRQAMSTLAQYNDQLATDIQYIRFALATTLEPIILKIVELAYKLLSLIGSIIKTLTGYNIFKNSGIDKFQKAMNKSKDDANELKKTLASFDEMNILNDNSNNNDNGGVGTPNIDLSKIGEAEPIGIQEWAKKVKKIFDDTFETIRKNVIKVMKGLGFNEEYINAFIKLTDGIKQIFDGLLEFIWGFGETIVGLLTGDTKLVKKGFKDMGNGIKDIFFGVLKTLKGIFDEIIALVKIVFSKIPEIIYELFIKKGNKSFEDFKKETETKFKNITSSIKDAFGKIPSLLISALSPSNFTNAFNKFKNVWNDMIKGLTKEIKITYSAKGGGSNAYGGGSGGGGFRAKGGIYYPKLASGGIINMPGRGVPYHGATIGEKGAEAVVPLTDSQQMALLGEAIGKYININATIVNTINGRVLSKELQKIQNQTDFATNGRW